MLTRFTILAYFSYFTTTISFAQESGGNDELPALTVMGQETANQRPVTTYETPISNLDFDPRVDMQSRNMAEAQGDLSIRGGTFENTGIQVFAFRVPSSIEMETLENSISNYNEEQVRTAIERAGGEWILMPNKEPYHSYDGSHLHYRSAISLSKELGKQLKSRLKQPN